MAIPAQPCECVPYSNLCCCGTQNGITVVQPKCQTIPDGSVVNNPAFVLDLNQSFWSYKFLTDCNNATRAISNLGIPICDKINAENVIVEEKIDGCGQYLSVPFELIKNDPNYGPAPNGFKFLKINTNDRFEKGLSVEYRISIIGNYSEAIQPIKVKAATQVYTFECEDCFIVPGCNPEGKLLLSKECSTVINNNQAKLDYSVHVDNVGDGVLDSVEFEDIIIIPTQLTIGTVSVNPSTLIVDTSVLGQVKIIGNIGTIQPGGRVAVTYSIPVISISAPGNYGIGNMARAAAEGTESAAMCKTSLDAVKLRANKCCSVTGNIGTFNLTIENIGDSPDATVDIYDQMRIPAGITMRFSSFNGCEAYFANTQTPIPLNEDLVGPIVIEIICRNALVPSGGNFMKSISYTLVASSFVGVTNIANSITKVIPHNLDDIIYQGTDNLPAVATIPVGLTQNCITPCE